MSLNNYHQRPTLELPKVKGVIPLMLFTVLANLVFWGGVIYGIFWCVNHFFPTLGQ
tara:strand:- start:624 stop:791 length:168 start_codon:yes stop_codon:yes gene_type:complete